MKHARIISTLTAMTAASGLATGLAVAMPASAATSSAPKYVVVGCNSKLLTEPANYTPYCADNGAGITSFHWTSWTSHLASGYGTFYEDDNYPNHAEGKVYRVPGIVTFWGSAKIKDHPGYDTYTEMTVIFPGQRPAVYQKVNGKWVATYPQTQTLGF